MRGKELSRRFFNEIGLPAIEKTLSACIPHLAVGIGGGSQAHDNDDEISRDHGWGPGFFVWFNEEDHARFAEPLKKVLGTLPKAYLRYEWPKDQPFTCGVTSINAFIKSAIGTEAPPESPYDWLRIPEEYLFELTPNRLFHDATGETTCRFEAFDYYPEEAWKHRLSSSLSWLGEWGIKHLPRIEQRGDIITTSIYWTRFATYAMKVAFLLNRRYSTYHKWRYHEFRKLPRLVDEIDPLLIQGFQANEGRAAIAEKIMDCYNRELAALGYEPDDTPPKEAWRRIDAYSGTLSFYAKAVHNSINDPQIKEVRRFIEVISPPMKYNDFDRT